MCCNLYWLHEVLTTAFISVWSYLCSPTCRSSVPVTVILSHLILHHLVHHHFYHPPPITPCLFRFSSKLSFCINPSYHSHLTFRTCFYRFQDYFWTQLVYRVFFTFLAFLFLIYVFHNFISFPTAREFFSFFISIPSITVFTGRLLMCSNRFTSSAFSNLLLCIVFCLFRQSCCWLCSSYKRQYFIVASHLKRQ